MFERRRSLPPGARTVALKTPLDLSAFDGVAMSCGFESDDEPERRTWKATVRTQNNRGEVVYQAKFTPPVAAAERGKATRDEKPAEVRIPWESFRLVRGPVVVPDVPPLSADQCKASPNTVPLNWCDDRLKGGDAGSRERGMAGSGGITSNKRSRPRGEAAVVRGSAQLCTFRVYPFYFIF